MFRIRSAYRGIVLFFIAILLITMTCGCSKKSDTDEKAAISNSKSEDGSNNTNTEDTQGAKDYSEYKDKIDSLAKKLNSDKNAETARSVAEEIKEPAAFIEDYLQKHQGAKEGAKTLSIIASTYKTIDSLYPDQKKEVSKAYELILVLYPSSPYAEDAKIWASSHN